MKLLSFAWRICHPLARQASSSTFPLPIFVHDGSEKIHYYGGGGQDLRKFLEEVGTDPREGRYWLKHFQKSLEPSTKAFAVVNVENEVFKNAPLLEKLASNLSFLYRHGMKTIVVHGDTKREAITNHTSKLVSALQKSGAAAYPFFSGSSILNLTSDHRYQDPTASAYISSVNTNLLEWSLESGHIPVVGSVGETAEGQLVTLDPTYATEEIAKATRPVKVFFLNTNGGFVDSKNQYYKDKVIENLNLPVDSNRLLDQDWCPHFVKDKVRRIATLLDCLPSQSSVVITSADTLLTELFTHHGSGTFFKNTEPIHAYHCLDEVDHSRVIDLFNKTFGRELQEDYMQSLRDRLDTIYLSEGYNACAVVTRQKGIAVPYLDKFTVSALRQGEGTSEMLWEHLRRDYSSLFWRSSNTNRINPWYFKQCEGSWTNRHWVVFWYGVCNPKESHTLLDYATTLPSSFVDPPRTQTTTHHHTTSM